MRPPRSSVLYPRRSTAEIVERAEREARIVSLNRFAELTGRDGKTLPAWLEKGCPIHRDDGRRGKFVDIREVLLWREEQIRKEERAKFARPEAEAGEEGLSPSDLNKLEDRRIKRQKLAMLAKILVHREPLQMAIRQANGIGRQTVMSIPEAVVRLVAGVVSREKEAEIREKSWDLCAAALSAWANEVNLAMKAAVERVLDLEEDGEEDEDDGA